MKIRISRAEMTKSGSFDSTFLENIIYFRVFIYDHIYSITLYVESKKGLKFTHHHLSIDFQISYLQQKQ